MKLNSVLMVLVLSLSSLASHAAEVIQTEESDFNLNLVVAMKSYYKGEVNLFLLETYEPAAASSQIAIVLPNGEDDAQYPIRTTYSLGNYCSVNLQGINSKYDAMTGLTLTIPFAYYEPETGTCSIQRKLEVSVKMKEGHRSELQAVIK